MYLFAFVRAAPSAYGDSQGRGLIRATAAALCHSHTRSELCLQPTPQLMATLDPFFFLVFCLFRAALQHMEVPRLGV